MKMLEKMQNTNRGVVTLFRLGKEQSVSLISTKALKTDHYRRITAYNFGLDS